ncbi:MAG: hypothetical protein CVU54_02270 [Deltaproteobacteria bacterium HGW-Deltaproteobacteria-12]|jgi:hypothetical protein|nr:MAG: hypothetical protein CVU54_02270 [Deltaproteobacteria bacterium HGW-Deltaproteobacteria-12]
MLRDIIDAGLLERFEAGLDPLNPQLSKISAKIIGYGEMSTIFVISHPGQENIAYKRMPIFRSPGEMETYELLFEEYNTGLRNIGINIPESASARVIPAKGNSIIYNAQERLPAASIGNALIQRLDENSLHLLFLCVLRELAKVFSCNRARPSLTFGIDGQISNWAMKDYGEGKPVTENTELFYIDTGTPLIRKDGMEQLNPELFLRSTPSFLVWLIRLLFLEEVMTRYYDFRRVTIDLIANFYKEQCPHFIPMLIETANGFFAGEEAQSGIAPITEKEIVSYYREDATIWRVYLAFRKIDRYLHLKIFGKPYVYILPEKIKR